ncbi:hypothetical protein CTheo_5547 [Ceratobasidium theobromae]|uniref:Uncharacterized protein n=1 Tax=Ceratobasidium theobromae TaxID=1582974 RepID=A0A5N5QHB5_9AGAM|nr:hypothetical protein CTheo_5547 [Ceratobasidium theobromae]
MGRTLSESPEKALAPSDIDVFATKPPPPSWLHESAPPGARTLKDFLQNKITKLIICTYGSPGSKVPVPHHWRLFTVMNDPVDMLEIGWETSEHPIPKIIISYCSKYEFEAEEQPATQTDFVTYGPPTAPATLTLKRLLHLIATRGLNTCLVTDATPDDEYQVSFATWIVTVLCALKSYGHLKPFVIPQLGARLVLTWKYDDGKDSAKSVNAHLGPVKFSKPEANSLRDTILQSCKEALRPEED